MRVTVELPEPKPYYKPVTSKGCAVMIPQIWAKEAIASREQQLAMNRMMANQYHV